MANTYALAFSPDGRALAAGDSTGNGDDSAAWHLWDVPAKKHVKKIGNDAATIRHLAFSPKGTRIAAADNDGVVKIWNMDGQKINAFRHFDNFSPAVEYLSFLDESHVFAVSSLPVPAAAKWNIDTNRASNYALGASRYRLHGAAVSRSRSCFAYCGPEAMVVLASDQVTLLSRVAVPAHHEISGIAISDDGNRILAVAENGNMYVMDAKGHRIMREWQGHRAAVYGLVSIPGNDGFVTSDQAGNIKTWDSDGKMLSHVRRYGGRVRALAISPDGSLLATGGDQQPIVLWDLKGLLRKKD
jgi:WD40 repeat protein